MKVINARTRAHTHIHTHTHTHARAHARVHGNRSRMRSMSDWLRRSCPALVSRRTMGRWSQHIQKSWRKIDQHIHEKQTVVECNPWTVRQSFTTQRADGAWIWMEQRNMKSINQSKQEKKKIETKKHEINEPIKHQWSLIQSWNEWIQLWNQRHVKIQSWNQWHEINERI